MYVMIAVKKKELYNELVIVSWVQGLFGYLQTDGEKKSHTLFCFFLAFFRSLFRCFSAAAAASRKISRLFWFNSETTTECVTKNVYV